MFQPHTLEYRTYHRTKAKQRQAGISAVACRQGGVVQLSPGLGTEEFWYRQPVLFGDALEGEQMAIHSFALGAFLDQTGVGDGSVPQGTKLFPGAAGGIAKYLTQMLGLHRRRSHRLCSSVEKSLGQDGFVRANNFSVEPVIRQHHTHLHVRIRRKPVECNELLAIINEFQNIRVAGQDLIPECCLRKINFALRRFRQIKINLLRGNCEYRKVMAKATNTYK